MAYPDNPMVASSYSFQIYGAGVLYTCKGVHTHFTGQRERKKWEKESESEKEREGGVEYVQNFYFYF